jgi:uncharacterized integral membrane protein
MQKTKLIIAFILILIGLVIILQNTQYVTARILMITLTLPLALWLFLMLLIGFALGVLASFKLVGKKKTKDKLPKT